jgi:hypothetical protein
MNRFGQNSILSIRIWERINNYGKEFGDDRILIEYGGEESIGNN